MRPESRTNSRNQYAPFLRGGWILREVGGMCNRGVPEDWSAGRMGREKRCEGYTFNRALGPMGQMRPRWRMRLWSDVSRFP